MLKAYAPPSPIDSAVGYVRGYADLACLLGKGLWELGTIVALAQRDRIDEAQERIENIEKGIREICHVLNEQRKQMSGREQVKAVTKFVTEGYVTHKYVGFLGRVFTGAKNSATKIISEAQKTARPASELIATTAEGIEVRLASEAANNARRGQSYLREVNEYYAKSNINRTKETIKGIKGLIKKEGLPTKGKIRYIPPKDITVKTNLPRVTIDNKLAHKYGWRKGIGFKDKFDNVWLKGESRTFGQPREWDVQLSSTGKQQLGWMTRDNKHLNVSMDGRVTHR